MSYCKVIALTNQKGGVGSKPKAVKYCQSSGGNEFVNFLFSS